MTSSLGDKRAAVDRSVHRAVTAVGPSRADGVLGGLSKSANHGALWFGIAGVLAVSGPASRRAASRGLISLGIASAAANLVGKTLVGGPRPDTLSIPVARRLRKSPTSGSFPSGHSASAAAFVAGVALEQPLVGAILAPVAGAVAYSRIHVGAHWFSDVVGGIVIGVAAAGVTAALSQPAWLRRRIVGPPGLTIALPALPEGDGLIVIANPQSGAGVIGRPDPLDVVRAELPRATIRVLEEGDDLVELFQQAAREGRAIGVCGGDGTVAAAAQVAVQEQVPLLVLPGGTLNHFAVTLGADNVHKAVRAVQQGRGVAVNIGVARIPGRPDITVLNTASLGIYPEMVADRERYQDRIGKPLAGLWAAAKSLRNATPISLALDGREESVWTIFAGINTYRPKVAAPIDRKRLDDGVLDVRILRAPPGRSRWRAVGGELRGGLVDGRLRRSGRRPADAGRPFVMSSPTGIEVSVVSDGSEVVLAHDGEANPIPVVDGRIQFSLAINDDTLQAYHL